MTRPSELPPLHRAVERLAAMLERRGLARQWYERYVATVGPRAVVDTANGGTVSWVHRRAAGSDDVFPLPSVHWTSVQVGPQVLWGLVLYDGLQQCSIRYGDDERIAERTLDDRYPGRLVELARVIRAAADPLLESVAFVAGLGDEHQGPGRVHYPVPVPGGVRSVWVVGLSGCRRALFDGRVGDDARYVVADGLAGTAVGAGATREEALAAYAAEVARAVPEPDRERHTAFDDYDDDGRLLARGELPEFPEAPEEPPGDAPVSQVLPLSEPDPADAWRGGEGAPAAPLVPQVDPITGAIDLTGGWIRVSGPRADVPPPPRRAESLPHVLVSLEPSPAGPPPRGRWIRLLGATGVTRHAARIEERDGFLLVGADLFGVVDVKGLRDELDRIDTLDPERFGSPEFERFARYVARQYRWSPATTARPEGLVPAGGARGPRFDAGGLDGDGLQAMVYRHRKVPRPVG